MNSLRNMTYIAACTLCMLVPAAAEHFLNTSAVVASVSSALVVIWKALTVTCVVIGEAGVLLGSSRLLSGEEEPTLL